MPIRQVVADDRLRIWRNFQVGQLLVRALLSVVVCAALIDDAMVCMDNAGSDYAGHPPL